MKFLEPHGVREISTIGFYAVADPGIPVGGRAPVRGVWTSDVGAFRLKCM